MTDLKKNQVLTTAEVKGDWKPIVFLFTDGLPTDNTQNAITDWKNYWAKSANLVAISFGTDTDTQVLKQLTNDVILFKNTDTNSYKEFFKWVTDSIKTSSESVDANKSGFELANMESISLSKIDSSHAPGQPASKPIPQFVVLSAKCQNTNRPYLMKYRMDAQNVEVKNMPSYRLVGAFQVDNSYFDLSPDSEIKNTVHTDELLGAPTCPCCGNQFAFAACQCGKLHCIGSEHISTCPWCGNQGEYGTGGGGFDINRTQG